MLLLRLTELPGMRDPVLERSRRLVHEIQQVLRPGVERAIGLSEPAASTDLSRRVGRNEPPDGLADSSGLDATVTLCRDSYGCRRNRRSTTGPEHLQERIGQGTVSIRCYFTYLGSRVQHFGHLAVGDLRLASY